MDPITHFSEFSVDAPSPSGNRHNSSADAYVKEISTSPTEHLDYGTVDNTEGNNVTTDTKCVIWCVDHLGDATEKIFDMKFWLSSKEDFVNEGSGYDVWFNQHISSIWESGVSIDNNSGVFTPESLPDSQNLKKWDGSNEITGSGTDDDVSQYIYLSVTVDGDTPAGVYGGAGAGTFRYRVTYKYI